MWIQHHIPHIIGLGFSKMINFQQWPKTKRLFFSPKSPFHGENFSSPSRLSDLSWTCTRRFPCHQAYYSTPTYFSPFCSCIRISVTRISRFSNLMGHMALTPTYCCSFRLILFIPGTTYGLPFLLSLSGLYAYKYILVVPIQLYYVFGARDKRG